jgi:FixJ family two-component response regulator
MTPLIHIVEDDASMRRGLVRVVASAGHATATFSNAEDFLARHDPSVPGCALLDVGLPGLDGFAVQRALEACERPVVFLTGTGTIPACARAMKAGAVDFLTKPVSADALLAALETALAADSAARAARENRECVTQRLASLTPREREVLEKVVKGRLNKQIAHDLGIVLKTVKVHRARMMEKMSVRSVAELVQMLNGLQ